MTADNCEPFSSDITVTADAATHTQTIAMTYLPADYTKVDEAVAKAAALSKDEYKDFSAVEAAVDAVIRGKNITEQDEVDAMAKVIEDAIAALEKKPAEPKPGEDGQNPPTGDNAPISLLALLFVSGAAAIGTAAVSQKKKRPGR